MMDTDILDLLEEIGRTSVARLSPAVMIAGETATARRSAILRAIRGTVLPRRLEFTAANGDCLAIEVNSSRITDVFKVPAGQIPDFETEPRAELIEKLAGLVSDISISPAPLELMSGKPDTALEVDEVGITFSEIENACAAIELPSEPIVSVVPNVEKPVDDCPPAEETPDAATTLAQRFFDASSRFASGRVFVDSAEDTAPLLEGVCKPSEPMYPDQDTLARFVADLAGWDGDSQQEIEDPQLIVMRPTGGKGAGLAVLSDRGQIAVAIHEARKLGSVVNLWTSLQEAEK
ncbi:hypothetical protein D1823_19665 (plasmid) [Ruegeria sp. AD91A]|uniref:hypothetical protein n=1 Tax=Ruegeria sp. AD91A TaxID=2293862 RepID=UPI000E4E8FED|nr:hypothetical protein [Ruegeria sp. AD91A]AXT28933.1 hypothetical protein D1823_19665 [Ruegeria sp. AD91A]